MRQPFNAASMPVIFFPKKITGTNHFLVAPALNTAFKPVVFFPKKKSQALITSWWRQPPRSKRVYCQ
jgi:hypothetical protein